MKSKILILGITAMAAGLSIITSCQEDPAEDAKLIIDQEAVEFGEEGGSGKVTYTVINIGTSYDISVEGMPEWISEVTTSVDGEVTFTVAPNSGDAREATLTLVCGTVSGEFAVRQNAFRQYPTAEEMKGKVFRATWCDFFADETYMFKFNNNYKWVETDGNGDFIYMTVGDWAQDYIDKYNADHPDAPETVDALMGFDFTDMSSGFENYLYVETSMNNYFECWSGSKSDYGNVAVASILGEYTYDETTGILTVVDEGNTTYTRTATIQFRRLTDRTLEFQILGYEDYRWTTDGSEIGGHPYQPWLNVFGGDSFPFMLKDYSDEIISWEPCGKMVYTCNIFENV